MKGFPYIGLPLFFAIMVTACRENQHVIAKPHGLELAGLPIASVAPVFDSENGHYAEILLRDGHWHAYVDGKFETDLPGESHMSDFLNRFVKREQTAGRNPTLLISAEGHAPLSEIKNSIRTTAGCGIDQFFLHVRPSAVAGRESTSYHSLKLDFSCHPSRFAKYKLNSEPLVIAIEENGSLRQKIDGSLIRLDDSEAPGDLPGLDSVLRIYSERIRSDNSAPCVRIHMGEHASYQRFIDVLCRLHVHGLVPEFSTLGDLSEPERE